MNAYKEVELFDLTPVERLELADSRMKLEISNLRKGIFARHNTLFEMYNELKAEHNEMKLEVERLKQLVESNKHGWTDVKPAYRLESAEKMNFHPQQTASTCQILFV